jgi:hypothetical protein
MIYGYYTIPKGKQLLLKLSNNMNSKRYFSNITDLIDIKEIESLFEIEPPFNIHTGKSHFILAKEYAFKKGSRNKFILNNKYKLKKGLTSFSKNPASSYSTLSNINDKNNNINP